MFFDRIRQNFFGNKRKGIYFLVIFLVNTILMFLNKKNGVLLLNNFSIEDNINVFKEKKVLCTKWLFL